MSKTIEPIEINEETIDTSRRSALSRLGLAASAAYAAPLLVTLSQSAHASGGGGNSGGGNSGGGNSGGSNSNGTSGATSGTSGTSDGGDDEYTVIPE